MVSFKGVPQLAEPFNNRLTLETHRAPDVPLMLGDRLQRPHVRRHWILKAVDAMARVSARPRQLLVRTSHAAMQGVLGAMGDSGPGLEAASLEPLFEAF